MDKAKNKDFIPNGLNQKMNTDNNDNQKSKGQQHTQQLSMLKPLNQQDTPKPSQSKTSLKPKNTLFVVKDGHAVDMKPSQIFDTNKYTELRAVTFSASAHGGFINKYLSGFKKLYIIEGLPDIKQVSRSFSDVGRVIAHHENLIIAHGTLSNELINFINRISNPFREKIIDKDVDLRTPLSCFIHDKFYLLSNPKTKEFRLVLGSANLSHQAMSSNSAQDECLAIMDNDKDWYNAYLKHYQDLYQYTETLLTPKFKTIISHNLQKSNPLKPNQTVQFSPAQKLQIKTDEAQNTARTIMEMDKKGRLSPKAKKSLHHALLHDPVSRKQAEKNISKQLIKYYNSPQITSRLISHSKTSFKMKKPQTRTKVIHKQLKKFTIHLNKTGRTKNHHVNFPLVVDRPEEREYQVSNGLQVNKTIKSPDGNADKDTSVLKPLGHPVDKKKVKKDLMIINTLMRSYQEYATNADIEYESRAMEALLYGFTAMFLGDIRNQVGKGFSRNIPLFFFIGGDKKTGKTSLLEFIMKAMGIYPVDENGLPVLTRYADITPTKVGHMGAKTGILNTVQNQMTSQYVTPLPINEIDDGFNYQNRGQNLIVKVAGEFHDHPERQYSALIGVTNNNHYNLDSRAKDGRSYYLNFSRHIDTNAKGSKLIQALIKSMGDDLFLDFAQRFSDLLTKNAIKKTYVQVSEKDKHGVFDFLYWSRQIMKQIYKSVGMDVPKYLPETIYNDNANLGRQTWRAFYINHYKDFTSDGNKLIISIDVFNHSSRYKNKSVFYQNLLPSSVSNNQSSNENEIVLDKANFFKWIKLDDKKFKKEKITEYIHKKANLKLDNHKADILAKKREKEILGENQPKHHGFFSKLFHKNK